MVCLQRPQPAGKTARSCGGLIFSVILQRRHATRLASGLSMPIVSSMAEINIPPPPQHFFKYRSLGEGDDGLDIIRDIVIGQKIYWPSPTQFNDPFDCSPAVKIPKGPRFKTLTREMHRRNLPNASRKDMRKFLRDVGKTPPGQYRRWLVENLKSMMEGSSVYSLATEAENILMWSHYANSHKGVCIRFDARKLLQTFPVASPIHYSPERPEISFGEEESSELLKKLILTKSNLWGYEKEWRLIGYNEERGLRNIPSGCLSGLVIGSKSSTEHRAALAGFVEQASKPLALYQAEEDDTLFSIRMKPINDTAKAEMESLRATKRA